MHTSLFELFKVGVGPSSSHTVGPMRAALLFVSHVDVNRVQRVKAEMYGSLALTGVGHGTDRAVLAGLSGERPDATSAEKMAEIVRGADTGSLRVGGGREIAFDRTHDLLLHRERMYPDANVETHPNGMRFTAYDAEDGVLAEEVYYSIGGGFVVTADEFAAKTSAGGRTVPFPFGSAAELLERAREAKLTIAALMMQNEIALLGDASIVRPAIHGEGEDAVCSGVLALWRVMRECVERGLTTDGILPGGLNVRRRASRFAERLLADGSRDPLAPMDWVTTYAMAVNEENAAGGRVVTAPTNGAAGVIPAIGMYYLKFIDGADDEGLVRYLLTAAAIGILYKENASISGAEVGCQGEVGVACSMAAGGLVAALDGTNAQVEHAAEIAMEHNLGMTCDPIGGLVQIPCIERNGMGAVKAVNAARMAMHESDEHKVSLDQVIATMYQTGLDMQSHYKETSLAGLALNIIEC